jgi:hypothetical protein
LLYAHEAYAFAAPPPEAVTAILILAVPLPVAFVAVIVYKVALCVPDGVPLIAQVVALMASPAGKVGDEPQEVSASPPSVAVSVVIVEFCVKVNGEPV